MAQVAKSLSDLEYKSRFIRTIEYGRGTAEFFDEDGRIVSSGF